MAGLPRPFGHIGPSQTDFRPLLERLRMQVENQQFSAGQQQQESQFRREMDLSKYKLQSGVQQATLDRGIQQQQVDQQGELLKAKLGGGAAGTGDLSKKDLRLLDYLQDRSSLLTGLVSASWTDPTERAAYREELARIQKQMDDLLGVQSAPVQPGLPPDRPQDMPSLAPAQPTYPEPGSSIPPKEVTDKLARDEEDRLKAEQGKSKKPATKNYYELPEAQEVGKFYDAARAGDIPDAWRNAVRDAEEIIARSPTITSAEAAYAENDPFPLKLALIRWWIAAGRPEGGIAALVK